MNVFERFGVGLKAWYLAWFVEGGADRVVQGLPTRGRPALPAPTPAAKAPTGREEKPEGLTLPARPAAPPKPARGEALTLLEALQREARLIDFLKEDIAGYDDSQIGAAVRDVHRDAAKVLERLFALRPVFEQREGESVTLDAAAAARTRLVGAVREGTKSGTLTHAGWQATKADLPIWSGPKEAAMIVAPAEVEVEVA